MNILITRPINESIELAQIIEELGYKAIISPLLAIENLKEITFTKDNLLITSKNAVSSIKNLDKSKKIFVVGKKTKHCLDMLGFKNVFYMGETVSELKKKITNAEQYTYLSGDDVTELFIDFPNIQREIVYKATKLVKPSIDFINFFSKQEPGICMLFSQRTAENLSSLVNEYELKNKCDNIILLVLSSKIANILQNLRFKAVMVAKKPDMQSMLDLLNLYKNG